MTDYDPDSLSVEQARQLIRRFLSPVAESETVALRDALQRTLAADVQSPLNVPPHDNSAMDGYALRFADLAGGATQFRIIGSAYAGHPFTGPLSKNECVRIMTGAPLPGDCDCVIMQEQVELEGDAIAVGTGHRPGQNIRRKGEDIRQGVTVLSRGQTIRPAEMGLLASLGLTEIAAYRKLRVALFSTGDEIRQPGTPLTVGQIYDSNRYALLGLLGELHVEILDMGSIPDDPPKLKDALLKASVQADALITSGGVSVGEADYMKQLLAEIGEVVFWKIAMKPGRPLAYGKIGDCHFFGLPGNPVAVMVTFQQFVRDALRILMGQRPSPVFTFPAASVAPLRKLPGRTEFQRGVLTRDIHGSLQVGSTGEQGSGMLSSMSRANCFIVLPAEQGDVAAGDIVQVQPFSS
jgi:molybdopterin molybdotransferase